MKPILLWNDSHLSQTISDIRGSWSIFTNYQEWSKKNLDFKEYSCLIVLCELNWSDDRQSVKLQEFEGINLVKRLRLECDLKLPVLFLSFMSLKALITSGNEILGTIGHDFLQLPCHPNEWEIQVRKIRPLSDIELRDVQLFSCKPDGIVNLKLHQLQGLVARSAQMPREQIWVELENSLQQIFSFYKVDVSETAVSFKGKFEKFDTSQLNAAIRFIEQAAEELKEKYSDSGTPLKNVTEKVRPWRMLLLDDEIDSQSILVQELQKKGVKTFCTSTAEQAMKILIEDEGLRNEITLLFCDYRLEEQIGSVKRQQAIQGYAFLQDVGNKFLSRLVSAIVYSGMPRQFLLETYRTFRMRTEIISKKDFKLNDPASIAYLVQRILETGDANYNALLALPLASSGWKDHLHETYLRFRNLPDFDRREADICEYCTNWISRFKAGLNPSTPMIKGDTFNPGKKESEEEKMERFEAFMKTRRLTIYLNLYFQGKTEEERQNLLIRHLALHARDSSYSKPDQKKRFFSQTLGLKRESFPFGSTMEELSWLHYDMRVDVLNHYRKFREKLRVTDILIGEYIENNRIYKKLISEMGFFFKSDTAGGLQFDKKNYKPYLFDQFDIGMCMDVLASVKEELNEQQLKDFIDLSSQIRDTWMLH